MREVRDEGGPKGTPYGSAQRPRPRDRARDTGAREGRGATLVTDHHDPHTCILHDPELYIHLVQSTLPRTPSSATTGATPRAASYPRNTYSGLTIVRNRRIVRSYELVFLIAPEFSI